jgi:copper chaperone CopZ
LVSGALLGWPFALFKVFSAAVTGLIGGALVDRFGTADPPPVQTAVALDGPQRRGLRELFGHSIEILEMIWVWLVVGVLLSAAISTWVPPQGLSGLAAQGSLVAALAALLVSLPLYVCATASVPIAAALVSAGMPYGAALVFLMAGPATNVATVGAVYRSFGLRNLLIYLGTLAIGSVLLGMLFDFVIPAQPAAAGAEAHHFSWLTIGAGGVVLLLVVYFAIRDATGWFRRLQGLAIGRHANPAPDAMSQVLEVSVEGMTCNGCARKVENGLRALDGVAAVEVDLPSNSAKVTGRASEAEVREAIRQAGFRA